MLRERNLDSGCTFVCGVRTVLKIEAFTGHLQFLAHGLASLERKGEEREGRGGWQERKRRESIEERGTREYRSKSTCTRTRGRMYSAKLSTRQLNLFGSLLPLE